MHDPMDNQLLQATADPCHQSATSHATQKHAASVRGTSAQVRALAGMGPVSASLGTEGSTARYGKTIGAAGLACGSCSNRAHKVNKGKQQLQQGLGVSPYLRGYQPVTTRHTLMDHSAALFFGVVLLWHAYISL